MNNRKPIPLARLNELYIPDYERGTLTHRADNGLVHRKRTLGLAAKKGGYRMVLVDGQLYLMHVVLWAMKHKRQPRSDRVIDHIDRDKRNNADWNLREVTHKTNCTNSDLADLHKKTRQEAARVKREKVNKIAKDKARKAKQAAYREKMNKPNA